MMNKKWWLCLFLCAWLLPVTSWALTCKKDSLQGATSETIALNDPILVSTAQLTAGTLLWRSPSYTVTFKCYDAKNHPEGENGYFYWDPKNQLSTIHDSLEVGVTYQSIDYNPQQQNRTEIGVATSPPATKQNCIDAGILIEMPVLRRKPLR